ncbi:hypothetical protein [Massilia timonae]|uniref:hypothetical protein n=1 Tax=Massilia timonae TaxID=47229 RepID=UPI0028D4DC7C|nr:hypothetical protein [Massilia timonae]
MFAKVKRLRERGQRMSDRQIASAAFVEGEVVVHGMTGMTVAEVQRPDSQVAEPLLVLYEARLTTMNSAGLLLKGEERPQGDKGPAYIQEWSVRFFG